MAAVALVQRRRQQQQQQHRHRRGRAGRTEQPRQGTKSAPQQQQNSRQHHPYHRSTNAPQIALCAPFSAFVLSQPVVTYAADRRAAADAAGLRPRPCGRRPCCNKEEAATAHRSTHTHGSASTTPQGHHGRATVTPSHTLDVIAVELSTVTLYHNTITP